VLSCLNGVNYVRRPLSLNNLAVANNLFCRETFDVAIIAIAMANLFSLMPVHLRPAFERLISAVLESWLLAPKSGEIFTSKEMVKTRL
jgi:hypothetical protein